MIAIHPNKRIIFRSLACIVVITVVRTCYYGSIFRSCIYTEKEIALLPEIKKSTITLIHPASIMEGPSPGYQCLQQMGSIKNEIRSMEDAKYFPERRHRLMDDSTKLQPTKLIAVTRHGFTTIDSGPGPIFQLILRDRSGALYSIPTIGLGLNRGEEFLKAVNADKEMVLSAESKLSE